MSEVARSVGLSPKGILDDESQCLRRDVFVESQCGPTCPCPPALESFSIRPKQEMKAYEVRLEEIRAALNTDFTETLATRERADHWRLNRQRITWEKQNTNPEVK